MSTIKEGQRRGGIGAADNVWPIGETKRGASVPHSLDALGVWALSWLDCDRVPRIMLSSNLMILWANAAARSALARRRDIENRSGIFSTVDASFQQGMQEFLLAGGATTTSWSLPRADGDGRLILRCQRIDWDSDAVFGVTFFGSGSEFRTQYEELDRIFGVTKAEQHVLADLLGGHDADHISKMRQISVETVRSHIRAIYSKVGVRSREALFHKLQPFRL